MQSNHVRRFAPRFALAALAAFAAGPVRAQEGQQAPNITVRAETFRNIGMDQKLDSQVPLDLPFRDEAGKTIRLGDYFQGNKPVLLVMPFYQCKGVCTAELNGMIKLFKKLPLQVGKDFQVVTVSINPKEGPELAAGKKQEYIDLLGKPGAEQGWHFLVGDEPNIRALAGAVGFRYTYDAKTDQYSHPGGIIIITPKGKVSRYFYGASFPDKDVRLSLVEASANKIGSLADKVFLMACAAYDPTTGKYGVTIIKLLRVLGVATALIVGGYIVLMLRRERRQSLVAPRSDGRGSPAGA